MDTSLPVDFQAKAKEPRKPGGGYPLQLSSEDLMKNFVFAALQAEEGWLEEATGQLGHRARKLKLPAINATGTYVLGTVDGTLQWIETEDC